MFSQACVKNSVGGGSCMAGGACVAGECMVVGGMHGKGHVWQGGMHAGGEGVGMCGRRECVAGEMATAADGTHPTGLHSCKHNYVN